MADQFETLKQKYVSVLHAINERGIKVNNLHLENDKLVIRGQAPNQEAKNHFWDAVKKVDPNFKDLQADISVASGSTASAGAKADVKPASAKSNEAQPPLPPLQQAGGQQAGAQQARTYTVKKGDTLSKISREFYGDANQYMKIFEANRDQLKDPDKIQIGQVLRIP